ncbi:MAG: ABC transporter permease [Thermodesulfobacteriaceae bacterium]|nr:ABC transporter permease [Thermodesulfobacteriaceae bacterium]MCX8041231.1 ABC transporter permease [Thermodesulfobacteriaceae bacterium]MDW8136474.1 ABC transporter permease [Thermodesulfobacterium sp.]
MKVWDWYPVFLREMLLFKRRLFKLGYLLSAMMIPIIYLVVFGLGLGRNVQFSSQDYLSFLIPGLVAMSSMTNSYNWIANSVNLGRLYFKTFQVLLQAPISLVHLILGEVFSGMVKGLFAALLIILAGLLTAPNFFITLPLVIALILNCFLFASLGFTVGMLSKGHEETATYFNFFILPMAFFCGTFFPIEKIPTFLKPVVYLLPLTHTNILIRKEFFDLEALIAILVLLIYSVFCFLWGITLIKNYSE